jgi:glycosyltransferase involved in cell wall biosynthesis
VVTAVYNVERYLPDFIQTLENQTFTDFEVVAVDDGSTDGSLKLLEDWAARRPEQVRVLHKENGGQASARNLGIEHANGQWVTFPDPDDELNPEYFAQVDKALGKHPEAQLAATNFVMWYEETGERLNDHPRAEMFDKTRLLDLKRSPSYFHGSAPAAFFRTSVIQERNLRFNDEIKPGFEDGDFTARYLLGVDPKVLFVSGPSYFYRKRADLSSTLQNQGDDPRRFTVQPRLGYLKLLQDAASETGHAPRWLQSLVLYELANYFGTDARFKRTVLNSDTDVTEEFIGILRQIAAFIDPDSYTNIIGARRFRYDWYLFMTEYLPGRVFRPDWAVANQYDRTGNYAKIHFPYVGPEPEWQFYEGEQPIEPAASKIREVRIFGVPAIHYVVAWVPVNLTVELEIDGQRARILPKRPPLDRTRKTRGWFLRADNAAHPSGKTAAPGYTLSERLLLRQAHSRAGAKYKDAWVFIDDPERGNDNAEHLFKYCLGHGINAWFVGPDPWYPTESKRNRVRYGTREWKLLMLNASNLISSQLAGLNPDLGEFPAPHWKLTYLQHGVIRDDYSRVLNRQRLDLLCCSTAAELDSLTGENTPYWLTTKEAKLTGLARFDEFLHLHQEMGRRTAVVVAPTWRQALATSPERLKKGQSGSITGFEATDFAKNWMSLISNPELARALDERNMSLIVLPHPELRPAFESLSLPAQVTLMNHENDIDAMMGDAVLLITDYSALAFDFAYLGLPTVYFQFDAASYYAGGEPNRPGYFSVETDGFGPVTATAEDAAAQAVALLDKTPGEYLDRMAAAFPVRDGRCCERIVAAIKAMNERRK